LEQQQLLANANPDTPAAWGSVGTPTIVTGQVDPWGTNVAISVEDTDAGAQEGKRIDCTFASDGEKACVVVVRPGNSLWRIARQTYGTGFQFTVIYEANRMQIKDADLIYPGQVFKLPTIN